MTTEVIVKKWGNSFGVRLPRELVKKEKLRENQHISIAIIKKANLSKLFGSLPRKMSGQEFKDMVREGWE